MDRREFLWTAGAASASAAVAGTNSLFTGAVVVRDVQKGGGRSLVAESIAASARGGVLPFALARFADDPGLYAKSAASATKSLSALSLSPLRDVSFRGFGAGAGSLAGDVLRIVGLHQADDGTTMRHELWSHAPQHAGGTSSPALFTAHESAFAGFEVTHSSTTGPTTSGVFAFAASGAGPQLKPGIYVLAGPSAATGSAPDLSRYGYTGDKRAPVRESQVLGLDFAYLSFVVHGEWV